VWLAQFVAWQITRRFSRRAIGISTGLVLGLATLPVVLVGHWLLGVANEIERDRYRTYGIGGDAGLGAAIDSVLLPAGAWLIGALALVVAAGLSRRPSRFPPESN